MYFFFVFSVSEQVKILTALQPSIIASKHDFRGVKVYKWKMPVSSKIERNVNIHFRIQYFERRCLSSSGFTRFGPC